MEQKIQQNATRELHHELDKMKEVVLNQNVEIEELRQKLSKKDSKTNNQEGVISTQADEIIELRRRIDAKMDENSELREDILFLSEENQSNESTLRSVITLGTLIVFLILLEHHIIFFLLRNSSQKNSDYQFRPRLSGPKVVV